MNLKCRECDIEGGEGVCYELVFRSGAVDVKCVGCGHDRFHVVEKKAADPKPVPVKKAPEIIKKKSFLGGGSKK